MSQRDPQQPAERPAAPLPSAGVARRDFLRGLGLSLSALMAGQLDIQRLLARPAPLQAAGGECPRFGVFDDAAFATLVAAAEQIVPADADPGATDFCSASLVEATAAGDPATAQLLANGLAALDDSSRLLFDRPFAEAPWRWQTRLLRLVEAGEAPGNAWDGVLTAQLQRAPGEPLPDLLRGLVEHLDHALPQKHTLGSLASSDEIGATAQQTFFAVLRTLSKLAFVLNFPETSVRAADNQPIFSDPEHLISDPDDDATLTGWTVVGYHEIDYEVEKLMWEWQAGYRVIGFDGVPILDAANPLTEGERLAARDTLWALADKGLA